LTVFLRNGTKSIKKGVIIYFEWITPIRDYLKTLKKEKRNKELVLPVLISIIVTIVYSHLSLSLKALIGLRSILPSTISILIGFSITCLTIIVTSDNNSIKLLKEKNTDNRKITNYNVSLYQWLLIMFIHIIIVEILLLVLVFFTAFIVQIFKHFILQDILLFAQISLLIHILLVLIRNIANIYFIFYRAD